jgi:hypothetical protein
MANALNLPIPVTVALGGTGAATLTVNSVLLGNGTSALSSVSLTAGQLLTGTAGAPSGTTLTANGVVIGGGTSAPTTVSLGVGQVLVGTAGAPVADAINAVTSYVTVTAATQAMAASTLYYSNYAAGQTVYTLPASPSANSVIIVEGLTTASTSGWQIVANTGQKIQLGSSLGATAGSLTSTTGSAVDCATLTYFASASTWVVYPSSGLNLTVA